MSTIFFAAACVGILLQCCLCARAVTHLLFACSVSGQTLTDRLFSSLSGGELFERITAEGYTMSEAEVINYMRQICEGVKHMHERNIIHLGKSKVFENKENKFSFNDAFPHLVYILLC